jgi:membrane protein required for colicin V production
MIEQLMWTDYVLLGIIIGSAILSLTRGFIRELISVFTWGIAIFVAFSYSEAVGVFINAVIGKDTVSPAIAMSGTFIASIVLLTKVGNRIARKFKDRESSLLDRLLGTVFGGTRGILIVIVIISLTALSPFVKGDAWLKTPVTMRLKPVSDMLSSYIPEVIDTMIKQQIEDLDDSAFVQQTKKLLNALFGLELEVKEITEEPKQAEDEKKTIDQNQGQLNNELKAGTQVAPEAVVAPEQKTRRGG